MRDIPLPPNSVGEMECSEILNSGDSLILALGRRATAEVGNRTKQFRRVIPIRGLKPTASAPVKAISNVN